MRQRDVNYGEDSREKLKKGVDAVAKAVGVTLGPKGRNVLIRDFIGHAPVYTKDGVTVAQEVFLKDPTEQSGADLIKMVAQKTVDQAGDGTTSSCILAQSITEHGIEHLAKKGNPVIINRGIEKAIAHVVKSLKEMSTPISTLEEYISIATISANNDIELGNIVGSAVHGVGENGLVIAEKTKGSKTYFEVKDGLKVDSGFVTTEFINNYNNASCDLENPVILITTDRINKQNQLDFILSACFREQRSLLIIAPEVESEAMSLLLKNQGQVKSCVIRPAGYGSNKEWILEDIAQITGTTVFSENKTIGIMSLRQVNQEEILNALGGCKYIEVTKNQTILTEPDVDGIVPERVAMLKNQMEKTEDESDKENIQARIANLTGNIGVIKLGARTEAEMEEKKFRVDDALAATEAAREEGIVPGGGVALLRCVSVLDSITFEDKDEQIGLEIVKKSIEIPFHKILDNAGLGDEIENIKEGVLRSSSKTAGYDAKDEVLVEDMIDRGIIDPTKVTRCSLENAGSIAGLILTTECSIVDTSHIAQ